MALLVNAARMGWMVGPESAVNAASGAYKGFPENCRRSDCGRKASGTMVMSFVTRETLIRHNGIPRRCPVRTKTGSVSLLRALMACPVWMAGR